MPGALRELLAVFTTQADIGPVEQADKKIKETKSSADGLSKSLVSIGTAFLAGFGASQLAGFVKGQVEFGSQLKDTSERLGVGTEELQKFQYAAKLEGVGSEEAAHSLSLLNRTIGEAVTGSGDAAQKFAAIGVSLKDVNGKTRPTLDVLEDVADHFQAMDDPAKKAALSMDLFGRSGQGLIPVLNRGGKAMRETYKEAEDLGGILGKDFIDQADKAGDQADRFSFALEGLKAKIALYVLPTLTQVLEFATAATAGFSFLADNTTLLDTGLIALAASLGAVAIALGVIDLEVFGVILAVGLAVVAVTALYLVFDDLYGLFTGKESVTGEILDFFIGVGARKKEVDDLRKAVNDLGDALASLGVTAPAVSGLLSELATTAVRNFIALLRVIEAVLGVVTSVTNLVSGKGGGLPSVLTGQTDVKAIGGGLETSSRALSTPLPTVYDHGVPTTTPDFEARKAEQRIQNSFDIKVNADGKDGRQLGRDIVDGALARTQEGDYKAALAQVAP